MVPWFSRNIDHALAGLTPFIDCHQSFDKVLGRTAMAAIDSVYAELQRLRDDSEKTFGQAAVRRGTPPKHEHLVMAIERLAADGEDFKQLVYAAAAIASPTARKATIRSLIAALRYRRKRG